MSSGASVVPCRMEVSSCGKKPFGITTYSTIVIATVTTNDQNVGR